MDQSKSSELPIPASAIEAAIDSYVGSTGRCQEGAMDKAFRKGLKAMGVRVEERPKLEPVGNHSPSAMYYRLLSRWLPVEQEGKR